MRRTYRLRLSVLRGSACGLLIAAVLGGCAPAAALSPTAMPTTVPTATVAPTPLPCPAATDPSASIDALLKEHAKAGTFSGAVLIACRGQVILNQGYGMADRAQGIANTPETKVRIGSLTYPFTAATLLALYQLQLLDLQDPLCKYLADCPVAWEGITLHHLLTHTSGIPDFTASYDYASIQAQRMSRDEVIALFKDRQLDFAPGSQYAWSTSDYVLLGRVIEKAEGEGFGYETILQAAILGPLGTSHTGYDHSRKDLAVGYKDASAEPADPYDVSNLDAAGALFSTTGDLYLLDQALYTGGWGLADRGQNMSEDVLDRMFTPHVTIPYSRPVNFGYGWFLEERGARPVHIAPDNGGASWSGWWMRYPEDQVTIIMLSNLHGGSIVTIADEIGKAVVGEG